MNKERIKKGELTTISVPKSITTEIHRLSERLSIPKYQVVTRAIWDLKARTK